MNYVNNDEHYIVGYVKTCEELLQLIQDFEIVAQRKSRKHNYGDIMGLLDMSHTICAFQKILIPRPNNFTAHNSSKKPRTTDVENLWATDVSDRDLLNLLDSLDLTELCYVSEETKKALLAAMSFTKLPQ